MSDPRGFLKFAREDPGYRPTDERVKDFNEVEERLDNEALRRQSTRCMNCGVPFCHAYGCPVVNLIPDFNAAVEAGRWREALDLLLSTNPFPEFTGRICPAPCEAACVLGINDDPVAIRQIELAIIEKGFELGYMQPEPPETRRSEQVAIIGSGPAGLAAAWALNRMGFNVTVYENAPRPGGILRYGIPNFKLEKWVVDRRIKLLVEEGVRFETCVEVGADISCRYLSQRFAAILLAGGALEPRDLPVPGREFDGIHMAMDFLVQQALLLEGEPVPEHERISARDRDVVVIGGGDTGSDCVGTAWRQGARSVLQFEIMPRPPDLRGESTPWPQWPLQLRTSSSHLEGGERRWCINTRRFLGEEGRVAGLETVEVEWTPTEEGGRPVPRERPDTLSVSPAGLVLLAMGFVGPGSSPLIEALKLERDARGFVRRDANGMTDRPGVFVTGDMTHGASLVVRAIDDGLKAAERMRDWLDGLGAARAMPKTPATSCGR